MEQSKVKELSLTVTEPYFKAVGARTWVLVLGEASVQQNVPGLQTGDRGQRGRRQQWEGWVISEMAHKLPFSKTKE